MKIKVILNKKDITLLVEKITWSGDLTQASRRVDLSYLFTYSDKNVEKVYVKNGDLLQIQLDKKNLFYGIVQSISMEESATTINIKAADLLWYLNRNKTFKTYKGTADQITKMVCSEFGVKIGSIAKGNKSVKVVSTGDKTAVQVIKESYGNKYYLYMDKDKVCVKEQGSGQTKTLQGKENLTSTSYQSSIENIITKIIILDEKSKKKGEVTSNDVKRFGTVQDIYKQEKKKDPVKEAKKKLSGEESTGKVSNAMGDFECVSGRAIRIQSSIKNVNGKFIIKADTHTISNGEYVMSLDLKFKGEE